MFKNLILTSLFGLTAILLGAFGAHAFKDVLSTTELSSFETGVRYQMFHVLVLLFVNTYAGFSEKQKNRMSALFFLGILFFSGSIYLIQLTSVTAKAIWFVTPLGGLFFIIGWFLMMLLFIKKMKNK